MSEPDDDPLPAIRAALKGWQKLSITCPRCGFKSYHPKDIEEGYCARCHDWTREPLEEST